MADWTPRPEDDPRVRALKAGALGHTLEGGARLIHEERVRHIRKEGWTPAHDDEHEDGELLDAAISYANHVQMDRVAPGEAATPYRPVWWPWDMAWWKPSEDPIRNLVKAGALIAAEIDRLTRRQETQNASKVDP